MRHPVLPGRFLGRLLALVLVSHADAALAQDAFSEFQGFRTRFGTNQFLRFEESSAYSTSTNIHRCEWRQTPDGFRFQRSAPFEGSLPGFRATLHAPDHTDTLLKYRILRRAATNRYESPAAYYLPNVPITHCTRFATNIDGTPATAFEIAFLPPESPGPVPFSTRERVVFDQHGLLRSIQTLEFVPKDSTAGVFPSHVSTTFGNYSAAPDRENAVAWDRYPVKETANDLEWSKALKEELDLTVMLTWLMELPLTTKLFLLLLPALILGGVFFHLIFGRPGSSRE